MKKIKDKKGRDITLHLDDSYNIIAIHEEKTIGEFCYEIHEFELGYGNYTDEYFELYSMNIIDGYKHSGIGTEMIKFGEERLKKVVYPEDTGDRHGNHLSSEGKGLIYSCRKKGIISDPNKFEDEEEDEENYGEDY